MAEKTSDNLEFEKKHSNWVQRIFGFGSNAKTGGEMLQEQKKAEKRYAFKTIKQPFMGRPITFEGREGVKSIEAMEKANDGNYDPAGDYSDDSNSMAIYRPGGGRHINGEKAMANNNGFVYAAVNAKGREVMSIDWRLYQVNGKDHKEQAQHAVLELLDGVNPDMTGPELKYITSVHLDLVGNAYWLLTDKKGNPCRSALEKPAAIYPLDPAHVTVQLNRDSFPFTIKGYKLKLGTKQWMFPPESIVHFRLPDPENNYEGVGIVQKGAKYIDLDNYVYEFMRKFFVNGARPAGFLKTQFTAPSQLESIKLGFMEIHAGIDNMNKIAVLPKDVEWVEAGSNMKELNITDIGDASRDRILALFGVSKTILGTAESDTNRATAETADYVFSKRVIKPHMQLICSFLNEQLIPRFGENLYVTFIDPVPEDRAARTKEMQVSVGNQPVLTINEAREQFMGLGPVPGGDVLMSPSLMLPVNADGSKPEPQGGKPPTANEPSPQNADKGKKVFERSVAFRPLRTELRKRVQERSELVDEYKKTLGERLKALFGDTKKFELADLAAHVASFQDRQPAYEKLIAEAVVKINDEQRKEVVKNIETAMKQNRYSQQKAVDPTKLFDMDNWIKITVDAMTPIMFEIYEAEGKDAARLIGSPELNPITAPAAAEALHASIAKLADSYQHTTLETLENKLNDGIQQGQSLDQLTEGVNDIYKNLDEWAAKRLAKTESFRTMNAAKHEAWVQAGGVKTMKWVTSGDENVCPLCLELEGKVISINDNFVDEGESFEAGGQSFTANYGAVSMPPLHPNCNCTAIPEDVSLR